jgi:thymidylate kinase
LLEAERDPASIHVVDAAGSQEDVQARVQKIVQHQLQSSTM